ncbi:energy-coupling factor transporter transmembrane component T, partial [Gordonibacter urolithinfaciens]
MLGSGGAKPTAFDRYHPAVAFGYFACVLAFGMAAMQPVYLALSLAAALSYSIVLRGVRATLRTALWQMPLILVMAVANPLFSAMGSTELFRIGLRAFYLESLVFGACMGAMLVCVLLWFSNASRVLSSDKVMALFGNAAPTIGLMLSMAMRLVPQFMRRGATVGDVQRACTSARATGLREGARSQLRLTSVLMGWGMEDSLETADAMRARGWGARARRTTYRRCRFRARDGAALGVL